MPYISAMARFERSQVATLLERLEGPPHSLLIITGPRQAGKTTIVRQARERCPRTMLYAPADEPGIPITPNVGERPSGEHRPPGETSIRPPEGSGREWLLQVWGEARELASSGPDGAVLVIDEVQNVENWPALVKGLWDRDRFDELPLHVVLLGSSPLLLQKGLTEGLTGRFERIRVPHWSFAEMSEAFSLSVDEYLYHGGYPGSMRPGVDWGNYVLDSIIEPTINRDIIALERIERPALLRRLFEVVAERSGRVLTTQQILSSLAMKGHPNTVASYLDLLENAGLVVSLRRHARDPNRRIESHPKVNVLNTALMTAMSGYTFDEARNDRTFWGHLVETAVGAHLYNTGAPEARLRYWRDRDGHEVDFVLERGPNLVGCEVKSGPRARPVPGLHEFQRRFPSARPLVVGEGGVPLAEFLSTPAGEWLAAP